MLPKLQDLLKILSETYKLIGPCVLDGVKPSFLNEIPCNTSADITNLDRTCYLETMELFDKRKRLVVSDWS